MRIPDCGLQYPLPRLSIDEPTLHMTFGVNTSPMSGREGKYLTSRQIKARLEREVLGNVSIEVRPTESAETFEVRGRGELQLAVLVETMRREGFEMTVGKPQVVTREIDGKLNEPVERVSVDVAAGAGVEVAGTDVAVEVGVAVGVGHFEITVTSSSAISPST